MIGILRVIMIAKIEDQDEIPQNILTNSAEHATSGRVCTVYKGIVWCLIWVVTVCKSTLFTGFHYKNIIVHLKFI